MKELRIKIGFVNGQKPTEEEKETLRGTMTVLARVVDEAIYNSVMKSGLDKDLYLKALEQVLCSYEDDDLEKAKEQLYMIASLVDFDAAFILENLVYPNEDVLDWFFEYFCEYRIDERLIDKLVYVKE